MGLLDRLRGWRTETQKRDWLSSTADKTAPQTFVSDLIYDENWNRDDEDHQRGLTYKNDVAFYICVKIAQNVFDDWFRFVKKIGDEEEIMQDVQKELQRLNAKRWLTEALIGERIYGYSWLYTGSNTYRRDYENGYQIASLDVFTPANANVPEFAYDGRGVPTTLRVWYNPQLVNQYDDLPYNDFIQFMTRPKGRSYEGYSVLYPVWDSLIYLILSKHALGFAHMKFGLGVFMWKMIGGVTAEKEAALETALEDLSVMRSFMYDRDMVESVDFVGPTGSGTTNIVEGMEHYLGHIAAGTGIPKEIITGLSAGAITGSEINNKALYATLNQIQKSMEPYIRELVRRMGYAEEEYEIDWNVRFATDEVEAAQARLLNAQADQLESMANMGMGPNDIAIRMQGEEKNQNPEGKQ